MRTINYIVIHHAAVDQPDLQKMIKSINNSHKQRLHDKINWFWYYIAYHYVIWVDWKIVPTRPLSEIWYHASNYKVNKESIWIMLSWNLDKHEPTKEQMEALINFTLQLLEEYPDAKVCYHKDFAKKTCPGNKFPYDLFRKSLNMASKFKSIFEKEVSNPVFTEHEDYDKATVADVKYLVEIGLSRAYKRLIEYVDKENKKDRTAMSTIYQSLKSLFKKW